MANGCKAVLMLADLDQDQQESCQKIGHNISLALQAYTELEPFTDEASINTSETMDLSGKQKIILRGHNFNFQFLGAPVLFHLQQDQQLMKYIASCDGNIQLLDSKLVT